MNLRPFSHMAALPEGVQAGDKLTTLCGKRRSWLGPHPRSWRIPCRKCVDTFIEMHNVWARSAL